MKTWRERNAEARARGHFTAEDNEWASSGATCACGEAAAWAGIVPASRLGMLTAVYPGGAWTGGLWGMFPAAVSQNNFDAADALLDMIEDRALALKREASC